MITGCVIGRELDRKWSPKSWNWECLDAGFHIDRQTAALVAGEVNAAISQENKWEPSLLQSSYCFVLPAQVVTPVPSAAKSQARPVL